MKQPLPRFMVRNYRSLAGITHSCRAAEILMIEVRKQMVEIAITRPPEETSLIKVIEKIHILEVARRKNLTCDCCGEPVDDSFGDPREEIISNDGKEKKKEYWCEQCVIDHFNPEDCKIDYINPQP